MFERKAINQLAEWDKAAEPVMTPEIKNFIQSRAVWGGIISIIPLWGAESIIYAFLLWNMYYNVTHKIGLPFRAKAIMSGFIINFLICFVVNLASDWLWGIGWIISAIVMGILTYYSGKTYIGLLFNSYKEQKAKQK